MKKPIKKVKEEQVNYYKTPQVDRTNPGLSKWMTYFLGINSKKNYEKRN